MRVTCGYGLIIVLSVLYLILLTVVNSHVHPLQMPVIHVSIFMRESSYAFSASWPSQFCLFVRPSVTQVDQAKAVQARITKSLPLAARKTLVSGTVKLFYKFEGGHPKRGR